MMLEEPQAAPTGSPDGPAAHPAGDTGEQHRRAKQEPIRIKQVTEQLRRCGDGTHQCPEQPGVTIN